MQYIESPKFLKNKNATINILNYDDKCFILCVAAFFYRFEMAQCNQNKAVFYEPYLKKFNYEGLQFPLSVKDIKIFCDLNKNLQLSFSVFTLVGKTISSPIYRSKNITEYHIMLLLLFDLCNESNMSKSHYLLITSLEPLISKQIRGGHGRVSYCKLCLTTFNSDKKRDLHLELGCNGVKYVILKDNCIKFTKMQAREKAEFELLFSTRNLFNLRSLKTEF